MGSGGRDSGGRYLKGAMMNAVSSFPFSRRHQHITSYVIHFRLLLRLCCASSATALISYDL